MRVLPLTLIVLLLLGALPGVAAAQGEPVPPPPVEPTPTVPAGPSGCNSSTSLLDRCSAARRPAPTISTTPSVPAAGRTFGLDAFNLNPGTTVAWDTDNDGQYDDPSTLTLPAGSHRIGVRATDPDGRVGFASTTLHVHAGNLAPTLQLTVANPTPRVGQHISVTTWGADPDGPSPTIELDLDNNGTFESAVDAGYGSASTSFPTAGTKTIRARATDDQGATTFETATISVHTGNRPPTVSLNVTSGFYGDSAFRTNQQITVNGYGSDVDGSIAALHYDLDGDGTYETAAPQTGFPTVTFTTPGRKRIGVRATDDNGATAFSDTHIRVTDENPGPSISWALFTGDGPRTVRVTAFDADGVAEFAWDLDDDGQFDDAIGPTTSSATLPGTSPGSYPVAVRVTDVLGASTIRRRTIQIADGSTDGPVLSQSLTSPRVGSPTSFFATAGAPGARLDWDLDADGEFDDATNTSYVSNWVYQSAGSYQIRVRQTDGTDVRIARGIVNVSPATGDLVPQIGIIASPSQTPRVGAPVRLFAQSSTSFSGAAHNWDLDGDGEFDDAMGSDATFTPTAAGQVDAAVRVTFEGQVYLQRATLWVHAGNRPPAPGINTTPEAQDGELDVAADTTVQFWSSAHDGDDEITDTVWDLDDDGDFDDATGASASRQFTATGRHRVRVRVTDTGGATGTDAVYVTVKAPQANRPPVATIYPTATIAPAGAPSVLNGWGTDPDGDPVTYAWDLDDDGDFDDSTSISPTHTFPAAGSQRVRLRVSDGRGGTDVALATFAVVAADDVDPPLLSVGFSNVAVRAGVPVTASVYASTRDGSGAVVTWDLDGDGAFDDVPLAGSFATYSWTFPAAGAINVSVRATDGAGRTTTRSRTIHVRDGNLGPRASVTTYDHVAAGQPVRFSASGSDPDTGSSSMFPGAAATCTLDWDLDGDGGYDDRRSPQSACYDTVQQTFTPAGRQATVGVRVTDQDGATAEATTTFTVGTRAPTAAFTASPAVAEVNQTIALTSQASDPDGTVTERLWDLDDDGQFDDATGTTASVSFAEAGVYLIGHKVRDDQGDNGIVYTPVQVTEDTPRPRADFTYAPETPRANRQVTFTSTSTDPTGAPDIASLAWDLDGDGDYDDGTGTSATWTYTTAGTKTVRLRLTDTAGATDVRTRTVDVAANQPPTAGFTRFPTAPAVGAPVTFTSTATDPDGTIAETAWDTDNDGAFDDGTQTTATVTFMSGGSKTVRQRVTDDDGAVATSSSTFTVTGSGTPTASFTWTPEQPAAGQDVTLTSTSTDPDDGIAQTRWDLDDDGQFDDATGSPAVTRFATAGTKTVGLQVTDVAGNTDQTTRTITVRRANRDPSATLRATTAQIRTGQQLGLKAEASDPDGPAANLRYAFDLGTGTFAAPGTSATATTTFATAGTKTLRVRVTDGDGGETVATKTVTVTTTNAPPVLFASADRTTGRRSGAQGAEFVLSGVAWDIDDGRVNLATGAEDDGISLWEWDVNGDGDYTDTVDQSAASLRRVTVRLGAGQTGEVQHTVRVRVTDRAVPSSSTTQTLVVTSYDGNRAPQVSVSHRPFDIERNTPATFTAHATDPDGTIASYAWDTDNDGAFDDGTGATASATFTTTGRKTVRVRVTDNEATATTAAYDVDVTGALPRASLSSTPFAPAADQDARLRVTATDRDGTIAAITWDTDNDGDFDDGTGTELTQRFPATGLYPIAARVRDNDGNIVVARLTLTVRPPFLTSGGQPTGVQTPTPTATDRDGDPVQVTTGVDPATGQLTVRAPRALLSTVPEACIELALNVPIQGSASDVVVILRRPGAADRETTLTELQAGTGVWTGTVDCIDTGSLLLRYKLPRAGGGFDTIGPIALGAIELIDPQGVVYDVDAYLDALQAAGVTDATATDAQKTQARDDAAISDATVTLQRQAPDGTWNTVNPLDPGISPNTNPQVTGANGLYQWDVSAGVYRVRVVAPGYDGQTSDGVVIPPPKLDLHIPLRRNAPPVAGFDVVGTPVAGSAAAYRSTSSVRNGEIAKVEWDFDNDGQYDDRVGADVSWTYPSAGARTVRVRATDADGEVDTVSRTIAVQAPTQPTPPTPPTDPGTGSQTPSPSGGEAPAAGAGGGGSPGASGPGGSGGAADTRRPVAKLTALPAKQRTLAQAKKGLKLTATVDEAARLTLTASVDKATAKKLKRKNPELARVTRAAVAGSPATLTVKLDAATLRAARKLKTLKLKVQLVALDAAGNATTVTQTITLRR